MFSKFSQNIAEITSKYSLSLRSVNLVKLLKINFILTWYVYTRMGSIGHRHTRIRHLELIILNAKLSENMEFTHFQVHCQSKNS